MNTSKNQLASTGRQCIAMQSDASPKNEDLPSQASAGIAPEKLHPFPIYFSPGYSDYLALPCAGVFHGKDLLR
ncbi:MAG: hypothetical protein LAO78_12445 [Acidobacteriia bacterium]|nr:hypothetical protein [Terriglobia bacterium]